MRKLILLTALLVPLSANADLMTTGVTDRPAGAAGYVGPGDVNTFTAWWGLRAYSRAQCTGSVRALTIRRASDNATANINILSNCDVDTATAATHCAATTCFVTEICNQVGANDCTATHDLVQATAGNQPAFIFNGIGARPSIRSTTATMLLASATNVTPATGVFSLAVVGNRTTGTCTFIRENGNGNRIGAPAGANSWQFLPSGFTISGITDATWHSTVGVGNGASSVIYIDNSTTSGTITGSTAAAAPGMLLGAASGQCDAVEGGFIDNVVLTPPQAKTLISSARGYWGF